MNPALWVGAIGQAMAAGEELGAFGLPDLYVVHHGFELLLVDARTHVSVGVEAIANFQFFGACNKARSKVVVDSFVHRDAAGCGAALSGRPEAPPHAPLPPYVTLASFPPLADVLP